jgi:hypothetical protein
MTINTTAIRSLLRPGLADVFGDYDDFPAEWTEIFEKHTSDMQQEIEVETKLLGLAEIKAEGASTHFEDMGQRSITNYIHKYVAIGFIITRQAIKDNLYKARFPLQAKALKSSMMQTKEVLGAAILNNGFSTSFPIGDGKPVFSLTHPIDNGFVANTPTVQTDFNETALEDAITAIGNFKDAAGLRKQFKVTKLIVPNGLQFTADRVLHSQYRTQTANNDINATFHMGSVPGGWTMNHYLTDTNAWFLMTDCEGAFKYYSREPIETDVWTDFDTDNMKARALERFSFGCSNFRGAYASSGAT